ncbi:MAG: di-trans,poly-cis-decaprenylcistransferase [Planctomycetaceae bacterium]|nr:di-trans,poly-cis-decaprenylcistransferase [Planctomycetaceae bacterium]
MDSTDIVLPDRELWPNHVAIIMDGNGRWAESQGLPRSEGHRLGANAVQKVVEEMARLQMGCLTLYCLSNENWKRPEPELQFLMHLLQHYMIEQREGLLKHNIRLRILGRQTGIPTEVWQEMEETKRLTRENTGLQLCLAINYGGRQEIVDACRAISARVASGELRPDQIEEKTLAAHLYTHDLPDPDLLIRTAGEMRVSNYLLWQISYSEIWVTHRCWPDFAESDLHAAIVDYARRKRKFGGLKQG